MTEAAPSKAPPPRDSGSLLPCEEITSCERLHVRHPRQGWVAVSQEGTCGGDCGTEVAVSKPGAHPDRFICASGSIGRASDS